MESQGVYETFVSNFKMYLQSTFYELKNPSWQNPVYILIFIYIACFVLETIMKKKINYPTTSRKGYKLDLFYVFFIDFIFWTIGFYALTSVVELLFMKVMSKAHITLPLMNFDFLPRFFQFLVFFIIIDLAQYIAHYLMHRINFLWKFHKIHHAQEQLGWASTRHFHWGEYIILKPMLYIPFGFFGFTGKEYVIYYLWIGYFLTFFSHCNIKTNWGIFNYIFINPETHYWHHSYNTPEKNKYGVNFASSLSVWDLIFGHFYMPKDKTPKLGVSDQKEMPNTFWGQMVWPFKNMFRKK